MDLLKGKVAVVTGAARGIGRMIALRFAQEGADVAFTDLSRDENMETLEKELSDLGVKGKGYVSDASDFNQAQQTIDQVIADFEKVDVLVNNAGIGLFGQMHEFSTEDLQILLDVNIRGTYLCCREGLRRMIPNKSGYIINISSVVGFKGYPNQSAYTASKHAVVGMTKSLAVEAQPHNIRASLIHPGGVDTDLVHSARPDLDPAILIQPEDIAHTVMYLLSLSERCAVDEIYIRRRGSKPF